MTQTIPEQGFLGTDSQRLLAIGGLLLVAAGMLLGDIFAMFILHPNNARVGEAMYTAAQLIPAGNVDGIMAEFMAVGGLLENRGTKVDAHSHIIHVGYIGLLLSMLQPWIKLSPSTKKHTAWLFLISASLISPAIFSIHYIGLAYSPFGHIGWGSFFADLFGGLLSLCMFIYLYGLCRHVIDKNAKTPGYIGSGDKASRTLLVGGLLLLVCGFLYGAGLAAWLESGANTTDVDILKRIVSYAASSDQQAVNQEFGLFGHYQMIRGINRAAHTHINEIGILLLLMSFVQSFLYYQDRTKQRWSRLAVFSAFGLPIGVLLEIPYGVVGSVIADTSGFILIFSLMAMVFGLLRFTGVSDSQKGASHD